MKRLRLHQHLTQPDSIALVNQMRWQSIALPDGVPIRTCFVQQGEGDCAIVLLHGFDSSLLEFRSILPRLARHCEVWAVDLLGFGFSGRSQQMQVNPSRIRQHLFQFCQQIKQPIILVGASMGGAVAIDFALHHPEQVAAIGLIDSIGFSGSVAAKWLPPLLDRPATGWLRLRKRAALEATVLSGKPVLADAIACALLHQELPHWANAIASFTRSGGYGYLSTQIPQVVHPTLILWGTQDDVLGTADAQKFEQAIDRSQLHWLPCGHLPHLEYPIATVHKILTVLTKTKS